VHGAANVFSQGGAPLGIPRGAALAEWIGLVDAIVDAGAAVVVLPLAEDDDSLTGMPYVAEAGFVGRDDDGAPLWLLPTMTPAHRRGERPHIERFAAACGLATRSLPVPWEGQGDVLVVAGRDGTPSRFICTAGEGPQARSVVDAHAMIARWLPGPALSLRFAAAPWFHGNTFLGFFSACDDAGRVGETVALVCFDALLPGEAERLRAFLPDVRFVALTRQESLRYATNALQIGRRVLAPPGVPATAHAVWRGLGLDVVEVALPTLFGRGGGAAVCLTNRLDLDVGCVPPDLHYAVCRTRLLRLRNS
jgi:N-dimethylarginine dimethylaminohydrolase